MPTAHATARWPDANGTPTIRLPLEQRPPLRSESAKDAEPLEPARVVRHGGLPLTRTGDVEWEASYGCERATRADAQARDRTIDVMTMMDQRRHIDICWPR
jgi:hypothetical protein